MFWNLIFYNLINAKKINLNSIKIKTNFDNLFKNKKYNLILLEKYFKNCKFSINETKLNYTKIILQKNLKENDKINVFYFYILLLKKQTYISIFKNNNKLLHNTNGIVLKQNNIFEKSRKKDQKTSILNLKNSIQIFKKLNLKNYTIINIKKIKPFLNKINKILKNEFNKKKTKIILTPSISFNKNSFKKIKSIKRRLRKKYNILDT